MGKGKRHSAEALCLCVCGRLASGYVKKSLWAKLRNHGISGLPGTSAALYHYSVFAGAGSGAAGAAGAAGTSGAGAGVASAGAAGSSGAGFSDLR